jgi:membrane-associated protease RseP (regulator of RpoE activity)
MTDLQRPDGSVPEPGQPLPPPPPDARPRLDLLGGAHREGEPVKEVAGGGGPQAVLRIGILVALLVALGVFGSWWAVIVVVALIVMIFLHELGHYLAAKRAGMKVTEFFIGFGPRIWSYRRGEVEYGVKAIPAGAYVKIIGMSNLEQVDPAEEPRTYRAQRYWSRFCVAVAGSAMHFAIALVLLFAVLAFTGRPQADVWEVGAVTPNSPAAEVGIAIGDEIVSVNGVAIETYDDFRTEIRKFPGETVEVAVERDGQLVELTPTLDARPVEGGETVGFLGIGPEYPYVRESIPGAVVGTFETFGDITWQSVTGLVRVFSLEGMRDYVDTLTSSGDTDTSTGSGSGSGNGDRLVSPIGAVSIGAQLADNGLADLLYFLAAVNIFVGLFNLVPLPPFDGGHIAIATYEEIRGRRQGRRYYADVTKLMPIAYLVVGILLVLFVGNLYLDITSPVRL